MIHLRPYQQNAIDQMRLLMKQGCRSILYQGATGSGKTALTAHMLHTAASKGLRSWFICHRRELIQQSAKAFDEEGLKYGIISAGYTPRKEAVQIASIGSLCRRVKHLDSPSLVVWDECHHLGARSWADIYGTFSRAYHIGLTATPARLDGRGLHQFFREILCGPSVSWLIDHGYLSKYKLYAPSQMDTQGLHRKMGDFDRHELDRVADRPSITGNAIDHYRRLASGKRAIVFAVSVQHSQHIVAQFQAAGIQAAHVDGETKKEVRDETIKKFRDGTIRVLSNVELFGEGYDCPAATVAILLRPTQSTGLYLQQVGRVLRPLEGKTEAIILDHAGNALRHGLPNEERIWSLDDGNSRRESVEARSSVKICPACFAAQVSGFNVCRFCGFTFEVKPREVEEVEGELQEIQRTEKRKEQGWAKDFASLVALGKQRHYRRPEAWASFVMRGRQAKKLRGIA
jgi:DNA repair protein RadD